MTSTSPRATADAVPDALRPLVRRRQFCLSDGPSPLIPGARHTRIGACWISSHPDLEVTQVSSAAGSLTLLGYLLDPEDPSAGNEQTLRKVLPHLGRCPDVIAPTHRLGGRWVLIAHDGTDTIAFHDAAGLRGLFHLEEAGAAARPLAWCASEAGLLAAAAGRPLDPEAVAYLATRGDSEDDVYWMPGDTSPYAGVRALLPNHYVDLRTGRAVRYWPTAPVPQVAFERAVSESLRLMRGQIDAASRRAPLSISMTAGWDSRLMLALCRPVAGELFAFTFQYPYQYSTFPDLQVPARLLPRLGIRHHVIAYPASVDPRLREIVRLNSGTAWPAHCADTQALLETRGAGRLCVTGDVAEVVKAHYRVEGVADRDLTAAHLAQVLRIGDGAFALRAMERWLASARGAPVPLLDLLCWEQMAGRWQAQIRANHDIAHESIAPFNCRLLLATMLGLDEARRRRPGFDLLAALVRELWPEALSEPINPAEIPSLGRRLASVAESLGVTKLVPRGAKARIKRWLGRTG